MRQLWKRLLLVAAMVVLWPLLAIALLWWDSRPKPAAKVFISYLKTETRHGSNVLTFVVTNGSDFTVGYAVLTQTQDMTQHGAWEPMIPNQPFNKWQICSNLPMSTSLFSVLAPGTNRWRVYILGSDSSPAVFGGVRNQFCWRLRDLDREWAWWLEGKITKYRSYVNATGPEMLGDAPAP